MPRPKKPKCHYCRSPDHKSCKWCRLHAPKCWMCRFYDQDEMTAEERAKCFIGDIRINQIECLVCGDRPVSRNRHDMRYCKCGKSFVDGGSHYQRVGGNPDEVRSMLVFYEDRREVTDDGCRCGSYEIDMSPAKCVLHTK